MSRQGLRLAILLLVAGGIWSGCGDGSVPGGGAGATPLPVLDGSNFTAYPVTVPAEGFLLIKISNHAEPDLVSGDDWWHDAIGYQVFTASFNGGALPTSRLDYLTNLGIDLLWTTPIFPSPSTHGYDTTDYSNIKVSYGGTAGYDAYRSAAAARGIRVVLDLVLNHTGSGHPWFQKSRDDLDGFRDWYVWTNSQPVGWGLPWGGGSPASVWHAYGGHYYYGAFWDGMPDLNYRHAPVRAAVKAISRHWLVTKQADGFRLDAGRYMLEDGPGAGQRDTEATKDWWVEYQGYLDSVKTGAYTIGELWTDTLAQLDGYWRSGAGLSQAFSFQFYYALVASIAAASKNDLVGYINDLNARNAPACFFAPFLDNHDEPSGDNLRLMDLLAGSGEKHWPRAKLAAALLFTFPGTPYIYYGTEIGMNKGSQTGDAAKRTAMEWASVNAQLPDSGSLLNTYRALIMIRRSQVSLRRGAIRLLPTVGSAVLAYLRPGSDGTILVLVNFSKNEQNMQLNFTGSGLSSGTTYQLGALAASVSGGAVGPVSPYPSMYVRGTMNGWGGGNPMVLVADNTWEVAISGVDSGASFKFEVSGTGTWGTHWCLDSPGLARPDTGDGPAIPVTHSGTVIFTFNDQTLDYSMRN